MFEKLVHFPKSLDNHFWQDGVRRYSSAWSEILRYGQSQNCFIDPKRTDGDLKDKFRNMTDKSDFVNVAHSMYEAYHKSIEEGGDTYGRGGVDQDRRGENRDR